LLSLLREVVHVDDRCGCGDQGESSALLPGESIDAADETAWDHWCAVYAELAAVLRQVLGSCRGLPGADSARLSEVVAAHEARLVFWEGVRGRHRLEADGADDRLLTAITSSLLTGLGQLEPHYELRRLGPADFSEKRADLDCPVPR